MKNRRIERLLEARTLEELAAADGEVASIWTAALREWSDAAVPGLSVPGAFMHVYQAAFRGGTALLRGSGFRCRGALGGHHYATFYAAGALGSEDLEPISDALQTLRGSRHAALYGEEDELEPEDLDYARTLVYRFLLEVRASLIAAGGAAESFPAPRPYTT